MQAAGKRGARVAKSQKPEIIERIFEQLLDPQSGELTRTLVTNSDVTEAILWAQKALGSTLSEKNPANFMKDIIRGAGASGMWPDKLKQLRIGGRQVTGKGNVFEFVRYEDEQTDPFPNRFGYRDAVERFRIQSVSMPLATKALGRNDETYLIQVAAKLGIVETHFALQSPLRILEMNHLQVGIKLRLTEVDSMYAATREMEDGGREELIITAEAKKRGQRILEDQVKRQVEAAFKETPVDLVVPIAMTVADNGVYIAEFVGVRRPELENFDTLELAAEGLYELVPPVPGINQ